MFHKKKILEVYILISLDVVSFFSNKPTDLVLKIVMKQWTRIQEHCDLISDDIELSEYTIDNNNFEFNKKFYTQIFRLGMRNCLSPICAYILVLELQINCISSLPFTISFFERFVDDIVTSILEHQVDNLLNDFNSYHNNMQFTIELKKEKSLPFLDCFL